MAKKPAKPAKAAPARKLGGEPSRKRLQTEITVLQRRVRQLSHHTTTKTTKAKKTKKPRKWSPDSDVALCSARAVAEAIRLLSGPVLSDADVLALYWSTACGPDAGQTLTEALSALRAMAGFPDDSPLARRIFADPVEGLSPADLLEPSFVRAPEPQALILGLDLPLGEPHAVTVDIDGTWWSWGEPRTAADFPGAVIDEAWAVTL